MRYRVTEDPFLKKQPPQSFLEDLLRPVHTETPADWNTRAAAEGEIAVSALSLRLSFPDPEGLLETAYADFRIFMRFAGIAEREGGISLSVEHGATECREAYRILVGEDGIRVIAADTEGVRRALIYLEDEMRRREGSFLPLGEIRRHPFVRTRISRCFFSPPSHASNEKLVNELASDIDYYPEEYLNRLAHDGINGLWLGASFHDILKSDIVPEYGADSERRLRKLNQVVEKCRRYGIGIYLFSVEPASGYANPAFENHPELFGSNAWGGTKHLFCPSTEGCRAYIRESVTRLFTAVPHLAGFIDITTGECLSGCGSANVLSCPRCQETFGSHAATLAATEKMLVDAVREVAPEAEFISWTYSQRTWNRDTVKEACELRDPAVIHMQNFEDYGKPVQLGRERLALDYWLSYVGPGEVMADSMEINRRRGVRTYAKIQACSSHEISSVPYVPAPGILYDKYRFMRENGISGVLQCWYFGNYPCMMNKAASELSFEPFFPSRREFLEHLAGIYWGSKASRVADAWEKFEEGYRNFPVSVSFEWFGPMQDSPAVPLHLLPVDHAMPGTWLVRDMVGGDRIGECLTDGHTIEEACELSKRMYTAWQEGNAILSSIPDEGKLDRTEQKSVASAISILFESGYDVLRFYELRRHLGIGLGDPTAVLDEMEAIVRAELAHSRALIPLCEADGRLGYHSEAHGYKFFKEKLEWRIAELERLLATEFCEVRERIAAGQPPLAFYRGETEGARVIRIADTATPTVFHAGREQTDSGEPVRFEYEVEGLAVVRGDHDYEPVEFVSNGDGAAKTSVSATEHDGIVTVLFHLEDDEDDALVIKPEFRMFFPSSTIVLQYGKVDIKDNIHFSFFGENAERRRAAIGCAYRKNEDGSATYAMTLDRAALGMERGETFRLAVRRYGKHSEALSPDDRMYTRLIHGTYSPDAYAFFVK